MRSKIFYLLFLSIFLIMNIPIFAQISLTITGSWDITIDQTDLVDGIGSTFISVHESTTTQINTDIGGITDAVSWRVDVKKIDSTWPLTVSLRLKRTTDGSGTGSISSGTSWQSLTETNQEFFSGNGNRTSIKIQMRLEGVDVKDLNATSYTTTLYYTVTEI